MRAKEVSVALSGEFGEPSNPDREDPLHGRTQPLAQRSPVSAEAVANPAVRAPALGRGNADDDVRPSGAAHRTVVGTCCTPSSSPLAQCGGITVCGTGKRLRLRLLIGACRRLALSMVRAVPAEARNLAESQSASLRDVSWARTRLRHRCIGGRSTMTDLTRVQK